MIKSSYLFYFLSLIKTKAYADEVINKLDELKESLYNKRIDLDKKMGELFSFEMKEKIKSYSMQEQVNLNDPESFGSFLSGLRNRVKNLPIVTVKIAIFPSDDMVSELSAWFIENFGKTVLVDCRVDKGLVGGAVITFNDKSADFSLRKRLDAKYKPEDWDKFVKATRHHTNGKSNFTPLHLSV